MVELHAQGRPEYTATALRWRGAETFVGLPLSVTDRVIGTLGLAHPDAISLDADLVPLAHSLATLVATLVARKQAEEMSRQINVTREQRVAELSADNERLQAEMAVRERAELALRESEARFRRLIDNAPDIIYRFEYLPRRHFTYVSRAITAVTGYLPEDYYANPDLGWIQLHPDDRPRYQRLLASPEALRSPIEMRWLHRDGAVAWVEQINVPLFDAEGSLVAIEGIVRNISERKQAEAILHHANAELARAARAKDEFLANMSHELRTPLNAILGFSELLLEQIRGPLNTGQQDALRDIEAGGQHLLALINDILDLSKVEAGRLDLAVERIVIGEVCQASLLFVKEPALRKSIRLGFVLSDPAAQMQADPRRLKQMLVNLLTNAVKFTPEGGQVRLEVRADAAAEMVRFAVYDSGIGIAPDDLARLFQPFVQLDSRLSRQHEGTGLGLALVRRLTELHGGSVTVESEVGVGSCFTITIPAGQPEPAAMTLGPAGTRLPGQS